MDGTGRKKKRRTGGLAALAVAASLATAAPGALAQTPDADFDDLGVLLPAINDTLESTPSGERVPWSNPKTGNKGLIEVVRTFYRSDDVPCREYKRTTERVDESVQLVYGTGCRSAPGFWRLDEGESREVAPPATAEEKAEETETAAADPKPARTEPTKPKVIVPEAEEAKEGAEPPAEPSETPDVAPTPEPEPAEIVARLPQPAAE